MALLVGPSRVGLKTRPTSKSATSFRPAAGSPRSARSRPGRSDVLSDRLVLGQRVREGHRFRRRRGLERVVDDLGQAGGDERAREPRAPRPEPAGDLPTSAAGGSDEGILSSPWCRPTSSTTSSSRATSLRQVGDLPQGLARAPSAPNPRPRRISRVSSRARPRPGPPARAPAAGSPTASALRHRHAVDESGPSRSRSELLEQVRDARGGDDGALGIGSALEAVRGLGVHAEGPGGAPDGEGLPVRRLQRHRARLVRDLARSPRP